MCERYGNIKAIHHNTQITLSDLLFEQMRATFMGQQIAKYLKNERLSKI